MGLADADVIAPHLFVLVYDITPFLDEVSPSSEFFIAARLSET